MGGRIVFRDSQGRDGSVELTGTEVIYVGRGLDCAVRTDDAMVSRRHSQIRMEGGRFVVEDLGSANGTLVNNQRVHKQALGHNDVVQCGSLWIRFFEFDDGPGVPMAAPGGKKATMVLDAADRPRAANIKSPTQPPPYADQGQPIYPGEPPPAAMGAPFGGPPPMPHDNGGRGGPDMQRGGGGQLPYGGPPAIPQALPDGPPRDRSPDAALNRLPPAATGAPSMFERGPSSHPSVVRRKPDSILVELGLEADVGKLAQEVKKQRAELESARSLYEREVADAKRLRAEAAGLRDRIEELKANVKAREEQVGAHGRVSDELRDEIDELRGELASARSRADESVASLAVRERQIARLQEEVAKARDDSEEASRQLMEASRTKDEGWKKLNDQLTEIEHLREVINEQERMLEERRVGLISSDEVIKELRGEKERHLKLLAQLRAERDESHIAQSRLAAKTETLEEENRRLGRMVADAAGDGREGDGAGVADQVVRLNSELKDARVELRKVEADRERIGEQRDRAESERARQEERLAQLEVELHELQQVKLAAESARNVAQDALAKAEIARTKVAEEALAAAKARDVAATGGEDARREVERLRRRLVDLEEKTQRSGGEAASIGSDERQQMARRLKEVEAKALEAERVAKALQAELEAARAAATPAGGGGDTSRFAQQARDACDTVNDVLSELRSNMVLVEGELPNLSAADAQTLGAVREAILAMIAGIESAKEAVRALRKWTD